MAQTAGFIVFLCAATFAGSKAILIPVFLIALLLSTRRVCFSVDYCCRHVLLVLDDARRSRDHLPGTRQCPREELVDILPSGNANPELLPGPYHLGVIGPSPHQGPMLLLRRGQSRRNSTSCQGRGRRRPSWRRRRKIAPRTQGGRASWRRRRRRRRRGHGALPTHVSTNRSQRLGVNHQGEGDSHSLVPER